MKEASFSDRFAEHLQTVLDQPGRARATLRRSLALPPGQSPAAFPYVEPFVANADVWTRKCAYLVAGIYAASGVSGGRGNLGAAAARLLERTGSGSVETRFLALLDADEEQLPYRLRQMTSLMSGHDIAPSWAGLFRDLRSWLQPDRRIQVAWARAFYENDANRLGQADANDKGKETGDGAPVQGGEPQED